MRVEYFLHLDRSDAQVFVCHMYIGDLRRKTGTSMQLFCTIRDFLYNWQTLTTGMIALVIGGLSIWHLRHQIYLQKREFDDRRRQEEERDRRRQAAVRALLPADLSEITGYATSCSDVISEALIASRKEEFENREEEGIGDLDMPILPPRVLSNMQRVIENVDAETASVFAALLRCYQVQNARMRSMISDLKFPTKSDRIKIITSENIEQNFEQTVLLYLSASDLFDYARGKSDDVNTNDFEEDKIYNAIRNLEIEDVLSDAYREQLLQMLRKRDL